MRDEREGRRGNEGGTVANTKTRMAKAECQNINERILCPPGKPASHTEVMTWTLVLDPQDNEK